ncbi:hypothetical protein [Alicyclobacillus fastidiosus]|uniref:hypothetical protein n=1 Tax=Alicyclobacillus fastidiosus TaxID=392011 RepID=UPI0032AEE47D
MNPSILVLDDATSAVDMETEYEIQQSLMKVMTGRTTFIIAHRISSLKRADTILVLDRGKLCSGGHTKSWCTGRDSISGSSTCSSRISHR